MSSPFRSPRKIGSVPCREGSVPSWDEPLFQSPKQSPGTSERAFKEREEHALDGTSGSRPSDAGSTKGSQRLSGVGGIDSPLSPGPSTASAPKEQEGDDAACSAEASRSPSPRPPCADGPKDSKKAPQGRVVDTGSQWGSQTSASQGADGGSLQGSPKELIYGASPDGCTGAPTPPPINEGAALLGTEGFQGGQDLLKGPGPQGTSRMDQDQARHVSIQVTGHREDTARGTVPCAVGEGERSLSGPLLSPSRPPADEMEGQAEGDALMSSSGPSPSDSSNDSGKDEIGSAPLDFHAERGTETLEPPSELNNLSREADGCEGGMAARHVSTVPTEGQKSNCAEGSEDHEGVLPPLPPHAESRDNAGTTSPGTSEHRPPLRDHQRTPDAPEEEEEGLEGSPGAWGASTGPVDSLSATNSAEAQKGSHADSDSIGKPQSQSPPVLAQPGPVERARGEQSEPAGGRPPARQLPPELGISRHLLPEPRGASLSNTSVVGQKYNVEGTAQVRSPTQGGWTGGTWRVSSQVTFTALPQRYQYSFQTEEGDGKVQTRGKVPPPSSCSSSPPMHRPTPAALLPPQPLPLSRERETGNGSAGRQNRSRRYSDKETARIARIMGRPP